MTEEVGSIAGVLRMTEKVVEGKIDGEDGVVSFAPEGGGGSAAGGCWTGGSFVEAVDVDGKSGGRGSAGGGFTVPGALRVFGGEPRKV